MLKKLLKYITFKFQLKHKYYYKVLSVLGIITIIFSFNYINKIEVNQSSIISTRLTTLKNSSFYLILEYTKTFKNNRFCEYSFTSDTINKHKSDKYFNEIFALNLLSSTPYYDKLDNCEFKNCFFTCNKSFTSIAHGLMFHDYDLLTEWLMSPFEYYKLLKNRVSDQVWIYWNDEPNSVNRLFDVFKFNWSVSYHSESHASRHAYGYISNSKQIRNESNPDYKLFVEKIHRNFIERSNNSVWFISNCYDQYRLKFAYKLSKHFNIIIKGWCKNYAKSGNINLINMLGYFIFYNKKETECKRNSKCESQLLENNKFYLAFESRNCTDYITEKFWRSLAKGIIPVVIQPSKESYKRVAPKDSYIHAQDFNYNENKLAQYLNNVTLKFDLYLKHMKWRYMYNDDDNMVNYNYDHLVMHRLCELCTLMNSKTRLKSHYYDSISTWFSSKCYQ